jgi:hypothetical protein
MAIPLGGCSSRVKTRSMTVEGGDAYLGTAYIAAGTLERMV